MLLMIDNYDSFTYNLVQYFGELGADVRVIRNDEMSVEQMAELDPSHVCISPGPCAPAQAGTAIEALRWFGPRVPVLGVCLGHQVIGAAFGGSIVRAQRLMHGKTDQVSHDGKGIFAGLPPRYTVARYHSLAIGRTDLPECLEISAWSDDGEIMAVRHRTLPIEGVQFHPEAILSEHGHALLKNFMTTPGV